MKVFKVFVRAQDDLKKYVSIFHVALKSCLSCFTINMPQRIVIFSGLEQILPTINMLHVC